MINDIIPSIALVYHLVIHDLFARRCHVILSNLRAPGEKDYKIPRGFLFNVVTCANYTCEIWGWILFSVATHTVAAGLFTLTGALQMVQWAIAKHKRLIKVGGESCAP